MYMVSLKVDSIDVRVLLCFIKGSALGRPFF